MRMQVVDLLAPTRPRIDDRTKPRVAAGVGATELFGQPRHQNHHFTKHRRVSFGAIGQRFHVYSRNHEHMGVGRWMNILERDELLVLVNFLARDLARGDLTKKTVVVTHSLPDYEADREGMANSKPCARVERLVLVEIQPALHDTVQHPNRNERENRKTDDDEHQNAADDIAEEPHPKRPN